MVWDHARMEEIECVDSHGTVMLTVHVALIYHSGVKSLVETIPDQVCWDWRDAQDFFFP